MGVPSLATKIRPVFGTEQTSLTSRGGSIETNGFPSVADQSLMILLSALRSMAFPRRSGESSQEIFLIGSPYPWSFERYGCGDRRSYNSVCPAFVPTPKFSPSSRNATAVTPDTSYWDELTFNTPTRDRYRGSQNSTVPASVPKPIN